LTDADKLVRILMPGAAEKLNAVAAGTVSYEYQKVVTGRSKPQTGSQRGEVVG